jgi:hypothetical protein
MTMKTKFKPAADLPKLAAAFLIYGIGASVPAKGTDLDGDHRVIGDLQVGTPATNGNLSIWGKLGVANGPNISLIGPTGVVFRSADGIGVGGIPYEGEAIHMKWIPSKAAFRAGFAGSQWSGSNIGNYSTAFGFKTTASGATATALGLEATAQSYASLVIGGYNTVAGTANSWVATDPAFVIGNGTSSQRRNAFEVLKNGKVNLFGSSITTPTITLDPSIPEIKINNQPVLLPNGSGNVGIGTTNVDPQMRVHVKGNILAETGATTVASARNGGFHLWGDEAFGTELNFDGATWGTTLFARSDSDIRFGHYAGEATAQGSLSTKMVVKNTGNVGIGTATPGSKLSIYGTYVQGWESGLQLTREGGYDARVIASSSGMLFRNMSAGIQSFGFRNASETQLLTIQTDGNVGIGTTAPTERLFVQGTGTTRIIAKDSSGGGVARLVAAGNDAYIGSNSSGGKLHLQSGAAVNSMVIDDSGNVGIGTLAPTAKLDIKGTIRIEPQGDISMGQYGN